MLLISFLRHLFQGICIFSFEAMYTSAFRLPGGYGRVEDTNTSCAQYMAYEAYCKTPICTMRCPQHNISGVLEYQPSRMNARLHAKYDSDIDPSTMLAREKRKIKEMILEGEHVKLIGQLLRKVPLDVVSKRAERTRLAPAPLHKIQPKDDDAETADFEEIVDRYAEEKDVEEPTHINKIRASHFVLHKGDVHLVLASQHISQARSRGHYKVKLRNLLNNKELSHSFSDGTKLSVVTPNKVPCTYKGTEKRTGDYVFQSEKGDLHLPKSSQLQALKYLKPELNVTVSTWRGQIIGLFVPHQVQYKVMHINTGNYAATLDNGMVVLVPSYVKPGDSIDVNTARGEFLRRSIIG
ncbi:Elongation factor P [Babesia sp. Xinjiang]|uniref:Elongation factor P n=1 Tax=Babesia sp. Xinjiang TaxID=462227 RepID=UPI000A2494A3|nr:Elongation factor P [Babesia sp. Xinjiang]ORM41997.1 Elongation factor P [Babesia sp. Xinjiang]